MVAKQPRILSDTESEGEMNDGIYTMEQILGYRVKAGREFYLIKWEGYSIEEATWEPAGNVLNPTEELKSQMKSCKADYRVKHRKVSSSKKRKGDVADRAKSKKFKDQRTETDGPAQTPEILLTEPVGSQSNPKPPICSSASEIHVSAAVDAQPEPEVGKEEKVSSSDIESELEPVPPAPTPVDVEPESPPHAATVEVQKDSVCSETIPMQAATEPIPEDDTRRLRSIKTGRPGRPRLGRSNSQQQSEAVEKRSETAMDSPMNSNKVAESSAAAGRRIIGERVRIPDPPEPEEYSAPSEKSEDENEYEPAKVDSEGVCVLALTRRRWGHPISPRRYVPDPRGYGEHLQGMEVLLRDNISGEEHQESLIVTAEKHPEALLRWFLKQCSFYKGKRSATHTFGKRGPEAPGVMEGAVSIDDAEEAPVEYGGDSKSTMRVRETLVRDNLPPMNSELTKFGHPVYDEADKENIHPRYHPNQDTMATS